MKSCTAKRLDATTKEQARRIIVKYIDGRRRFAWRPQTLADGSTVWLKFYWEYVSVTRWTHYWTGSMTHTSTDYSYSLANHMPVVYRYATKSNDHRHVSARVSFKSVAPVNNAVLMTREQDMMLAPMFEHCRVKLGVNKAKAMRHAA